MMICLDSFVNKLHFAICTALSIVDGNWGEWTMWCSCSVTCGSGTRERSRMCNDPAPKHGGKDCVGSNSDSDNCTESPCPSKPCSK